jgi:tRNA(Arg) A34 adenosine deaminase TadA
MTMGDLAPLMRHAVELAWESFCSGSLGIGAVVTRHGEVFATGRNRIGERDPGDDVLAGTSLAHAEMNALAKIPWATRSDGLALWTTLQPCLQCLGAIRLSPVRTVHVLAPDPLFRGVEQARHLSEFIGRDWPDIAELAVDEWSVLSLLLHTHVVGIWQVEVPGWNDALPAIADLAQELIGSGELIAQVVSATPLATVAEGLWNRLGACRADVERVASIQLDTDRPPGTDRPTERA